MSRKKNLAWHFIRRVDGKDILRDRTEAPPDGVWLEYDGPLVMCKSGLHYCRHPFDALQYAHGGILCLVEVGGEIIEPSGDDKGVCSRRKIIKRGDMTELLRYFTRMQALSVCHLYDISDIELDYLMTGDEAIMAASEAASEAASLAASEAASRAASRAASEAASWAASAAPCAASRAASRAASEAASWAASWAASRAASEAASWAASWAAQREYFAMLIDEAFR